MSSKPLRSLLASLFALTLVCAAPTVHAQADDDDPDAVAQAKEHYKAGLEAYKTGNYDVAIRELKKAYLLKKLPPLLLNIGATYRKMGDVDLSLHFYQKFLDEAPSDAKDRPEVERIIAELKTPKAGDETSPRKDEDTVAKEPKRPAGEWAHTVIDAAPPDTPIDVAVSSPVMKGVRTYVYYRGPGQADYASILMKRRGHDKVGRIPAEAVSGSSLQYYIEAKDSAGTVVKSSGSQGNPNIIMIEDGVKPVMLASLSTTGEHDEQADEEAGKGKHHGKPQVGADDDDEAAPMNGADLKTSTSKKTKKKQASASSGEMTTLRKAGYALIGAGGGFALIGAILVPVGIHQANNVIADSKNPVDGNGNHIFYNNDPNAGGAGQEASLYNQAKSEAIAGDVLLGIGGASLAVGIACVVADIVTDHAIDSPKPASKSKKPAKPHHSSDDEARNWYLAPSASPTSVGLAGGFRF